MPPHVTWTRRAEQRYSNTVQVGVSPEIARRARDELDGRLRTAFAGAEDLIVLNYYVGFKKREGEHILRIDVHRPDSANTYVLKLAESDRLAGERDAWALCGLSDTNPVFMPLLAFPDPNDPGKLVAIAYQDAEAHIGAESMPWLETAARDAVRFDRPTTGSILDVIRDVYTQARRLHESARLKPAGKDGVELMPDRNEPGRRYDLIEIRRLWDEQPDLNVRRRLNAAFPFGFAGFLDPVDYSEFLDCEQKAKSVLPEQLRGLAHGDLHGRNLLVGIDRRDEASFPGLFDYEHIHPDNLVGWDFVEMETELKIRCYEVVFPEPREVPRSRQIQAFEWRLAELTEQAHESGRWVAPGGDPGTPESRLTSILLSIRREAHETLGRPRAWSIEWFREYLLLLGAYGLSTVRYANQTHPERAGAYLSAGVAAAYLEKIHGLRPATPTPIPDLADWACPGSGVPLAVAHAWNRGSEDERRLAETLLDGLIDRYPAALNVWYEWAFNRARQGHFDAALACLRRIHETFGDALGEDVYSLWGRCFKEDGDRRLALGRAFPRGSADRRCEFEDADESYKKAVDRYRKAYEAEGGFFPGINLATLLFLRAGINESLGFPEQAASLRRESKAEADRLKQSILAEKLPDDNIWRRATKAEAAVLGGDWTYAAKRYRSALDCENRREHHPASMGNQLRRLIEAYSLFGETVPREPFAAIVPEMLAYFPEETAP